MTEPMQRLLEIAGLNVYYAGAHVLFDIDLTLARGEVLALLGRNGAGKSTTLKSVIGLVPPASGTVRFDGVPVEKQPSYMLARLGIGYVPEERRIFSDLTVEENLEVGRQPRRAGAPYWTPNALFHLFPNLAELRRRMGSRISGGEQQMLTIARTLMGNPLLLLLDEPSEGLAPKVVEGMAETIGRLKREGLTVLLSEQNLRFAARVADRAAIIENGRIRYSGLMSALLADEAVQQAYLRA
ncbi:MAG TPA: ABC transporter ATP-binding protein [Stellaceae bacterium]|nr:ABC transporter ATP-binding protein [Stellaceae bacterium]